jgi:dipeptidyl-peptidase-4
VPTGNGPSRLSSPLRARARRVVVSAALPALAGIALTAARPAPLVAQGAPLAPAPADTGLSVDRIFATDAFAALSPDALWSADGESWTRIERSADGRTELWRVEAVTGARTKLISARELVPPGGTSPLELADHAFSPDGRRVLLFADVERVWRDRTRGAYWVFDIPTRRLLPTASRPGGQMFAKFSPDGTRVAYARDGDLWVTELATGEARRLTRDGGEAVTNGTSDWVYEEELGLRDAFRWSPDGSRIAYWRFDTSPIPTFPLVDETAGVYPEIREIRYPKAGRPNSRVRVGTIEVATGVTTWLDTGGDEDIYLPRMEWAASDGELLIQRLDRRQRTLDLLLADAATGESRLLFSEVDDAWVGAREVRWLAGGARFLWTSDRDGWRHIYLYERDGRLIRALTRGAWDVTRVVSADETAGTVWFLAASESPLTRTLHRVRLDGGDESEVVRGGRGWREIRMSPDGRRFLEGFSTIGTPPRWTLRSAADGSELRAVETNEVLAGRLAALELREPEFIALEAADGTALNGWVIKPRDFDPGRRYPLLLYVYGGPGSQTVVDRWGAGRPDRYLWHQSLVREGVLVASVDGRGTGARGRAFEKQVNRRLGQLETEDQLAAIRQLGDLPYVDPARVAIWGWSYGGTMSLLAAFRGGEALRASVAVAPVTDWRLYDTVYTERYMGTPGENAEGYRLGAPLTWAEGLRSELLVVHGTGDDNVHVQNTMMLAERLTEAGLPFRMHLYPGRTHAIEGAAARVHLYRMMSAFLREALGPGTGEPASAPALRLGLGVGPGRP